jgi:allantoin racemase
MKILVINPNTTERMTRAMADGCRSVCAPGTELLMAQPASGVASIEGQSDGAIAAFHMLELIRDEQRTHAPDGFVIACFDDTGLHAARELVAGPVVGIGEAAFHLASLVSARFSILTSLQRSVAIIERNALAYGFSGHNFRVHASDINVLDLENESSYAALADKARKLLAADKSECLVLGCGGMTQWTARLTRDLGVPVIDGVTAALKLVESLVALGIGTSKAISYAYPLTK